MLNIVSLNNIPRKEDVVDAPTDDIIQLYEVCREMEGICKKNRGVGLAAVQVGIPWRLFIIAEKSNYIYFVNCNYTPLLPRNVQSIEGCLSLPNQYFLINRYPKIRLIGKILQRKVNKLHNIDFILEYPSNAKTIVVQHEIDHQKGILISQKGKIMQGK